MEQHYKNSTRALDLVLVAGQWSRSLEGTNSIQQHAIEWDKTKPNISRTVWMNVISKVSSSEFKKTPSFPSLPLAAYFTVSPSLFS